MRILIAGGGTGGHLFPGLAVAEELRARGHEVRFVGTHKGIEARAVPAADYPIDFIDIAGIKRSGWKAALRGVYAVPRAMGQSSAILRAHRPDVVVGVGGYASGPMVLTAALSGRPTAILEQNSIPGFTNRTLGRFAKATFGAFETARASFPKKRYRLVGNPVRKRVRDVLAHAHGNGDARSVLVVGGSQGAHAVNELVLGAMIELHKQGVAPKLLHQAGEKDRADLQRRYAEAGVAVDVRAFIDDMGAAYRDAAVVIARAGASTLAELTLVGKPALLIPLPTAADDHQTVNARELADAGAAQLLPQASTTAQSLAAALRALLDDEVARDRMKQASLALAHPHAHEEIADALESLAHVS
ncbi:MAG TPA: undecaprenyldiphospho-muramoylpentapeptide beta-N-acetylglucosaminyltransferase [Polyangia bacterium]|jgi:UDP-N-acetylglucosamine--N-acetylmuramyl-(pentapeptide) pyrophosphoryl-undecaprenol N-acetylglucosamine transferase|nr:undecaprenyldiphospho-muramoylpentapeptide beta-N-acetylglucosaminyltransferase [Polyangia bacterium]HWE28731.1 undecaprenyldiphospho-muramoylpentapeptide beta-N-acetylglucosaminyltransferase [Polyangia bacterium]